MKCCQQLKGEGSFRHGNTAILTQRNGGLSPVKQGWRRCVRLAAAWDAPRLLCKPVGHYCVQDVTSLKPFMSHINPLHACTSHSYNIHFNIILPYTQLAVTFGNSTFWRQSAFNILTIHYILHSDDTLHSTFWGLTAFYILTTQYILHSNDTLHSTFRLLFAFTPTRSVPVCTWRLTLTAHMITRLIFIMRTVRVYCEVITELYTSRRN